MVSLFEKAHKMKNNNIKPTSITHQDFLKRIKKSLYLGPSNPNRMTSSPLANLTSLMFTESHKNYSLNTLNLDTISRIRQQTPATLILSLIYLERLNKLDPLFAKTVSPSELFLVTLMVSTKFYADYDELEVFTSAWAEEGRVDIKDLKQLEISFLNAIQWNLVVSKNEFYEKLKTVERLLAMKEGLYRGWFTYTELEMLLPSIEIAKRIINYTTILMFSYACSIATIALSSIILASIPAATDLSTSSASNQSSCEISSTLLPTINLMTDENSFDELLLDLENLPRNNFTIHFPLLNDIMNWEIKKNYQDITNFRLMPTKFDPVPIHW